MRGMGTLAAQLGIQDDIRLLRQWTGGILIVSAFVRVRRETMKAH